MRKYLFNFSIITTLFGAVGLARTTQRGPRDWRLILMWISWLISVAIAVGTVAEATRDDVDYEEF